MACQIALKYAVVYDHAACQPAAGGAAAFPLMIDTPIVCCAAATEARWKYGAHFAYYSATTVIARKTTVPQRKERAQEAEEPSSGSSLITGGSVTPRPPPSHSRSSYSADPLPSLWWTRLSGHAVHVSRTGARSDGAHQGRHPDVRMRQWTSAREYRIGVKVS